MATLTADQVYAAARGAGATHAEAITLTAIAKGESGWRNDAHNPVGRDNSYGLWQINMLGDMGPARRKTFGIANNEQLFDPRVNARAALTILRSQGLKAWTVYTKGIYKQYLPEATAAGNKWKDDWQSPARSLNQAFPAGAGYLITPNSAGQTLGPDGTTTSGGGTPGATGGLPPNASPQQIEQYIRDNFPQAAGFLDIPEIREKLIAAARGQWTNTKLQSEMMATTWWRTNSESVRTYHALRNTDPSQLESMLAAKQAELDVELARLGLPKADRATVEESVRFGWTAEQTRANFAGRLQSQSDQSGLADASAPDVTADQLLAMARNEYLMPISRQDAERWAIDIYAGRKTEDQVRAMLLRQGQARFPGLAEGFSPGEYMAPVRNVIAETLELDPSAVDLLDRRWSAVLEQGGDEKGGFRPMTISEAQKWARSQTEYRFTKGAQGEAAAMAETLGQKFGAVA